MRVIAIDWSGKKGSACRKTIWIAEARDGSLTRLENGRSRDEVVAWLIGEQARGERGCVGLDFAFSLPRWYLAERGYSSAPDLWRAMTAGGAEDLLARCEPPFWGRPGRKRPSTPQLRQTEAQLEFADLRPKSVFQIGGAGAVGTGSLRGMSALHALHGAGFGIWPFTEPHRWTAIEIYPRLLTGAVTKSSPTERRAYLARRYPDLPDPFRDLAASTEDAFDAAVSALVMHAHVGDLEALAPADDATTRLEGAIWAPRDRTAACPFCSPSESRRIFETDEVIALWDGYPVSEGHALVTPRRHVARWSETTVSERAGLTAAIGRAQEAIAARAPADGFTIGINDGAAAGQTVPHLHLHVIPRRAGDVPDPRGGIRWVLPQKARYW